MGTDREERTSSSAARSTPQMERSPGKQRRSDQGEQAPIGASESSSSFANADAVSRMDDWAMNDDLVCAMGLDAPATSAAPANTRTITPPKGGLDKPGFIDHSDGANLRTGPAEAGGEKVRDAPLPPATRVFVSGTHSAASQWWYVTAFLPGEVVRGYVQDLRVTTDLPEPLAKLYAIQPGDTAEALAVREFHGAVRDGHDLRYYENVLLKVNRDRGRAGITGSYQDPGLLGGGSNNIQLVAGHRIWLVSPDYARSLEGIVPDGSLTNGAYAKAKRFAAHLTDILASVTQSPQFLTEVAGEYAQAIADHIVEIVGIVAGFIAAEALSAFLATSPTGVGQIVAVLIQLALTAFGAAGMVEASVQAMSHGTKWLTTAWTADGKQDSLATASKEFLKMLVAIAMAALAYTGAKGNFNKSLQIANSMPMATPAFAVAGGGRLGGSATVGAAIAGPGPLTGVGAGGAKMVKHEGEGGSGSSQLSSESARAELEQIKQRLKEGDLSGKEKSRLRARKKELQEQLGLGEEAATETAAPSEKVFKRRAAGLTGKEAATDIPSWAKSMEDARPYVGEPGIDFATRLMDKHYGAGNWSREGKQATELSQLKKFGDRAFE